MAAGKIRRRRKRRQRGRISQREGGGKYGAWQKTATALAAKSAKQTVARQYQKVLQQHRAISGMAAYGIARKMSLKTARRFGGVITLATAACVTSAMAADDNGVMTWRYQAQQRSGVVASKTAERNQAAASIAQRWWRAGAGHRVRAGCAYRGGVAPWSIAASARQNR